MNASDSANVLMGGKGNQVMSTTFNFSDCNIDLQGTLNDLVRELRNKGSMDDAEELIEAVELLETVEESTSKKEIRKKGIFKKLGRIVKDLGDEDSNLSKTVKGMKRGVEIAQDIAAEYNKIAQWLGMPQVPTPFLKKSEKSK